MTRKLEDPKKIRIYLKTPTFSSLWIRITKRFWEDIKVRSRTVKIQRYTKVLNRVLKMFGMEPSDTLNNSL